MMQPEAASAIRPVEQAGRLLGSIVAAGQSRVRAKRRGADAGTRAAAVRVWLKAGRTLASADDDVEAFVRAYQDAFRAYLLS